MEKLIINIDDSILKKIDLSNIEQYIYKQLELLNITISESDNKTIDKNSLPVIWAKKQDVTALFGASGNHKLNLTEIRKSWKREK